ncbi:MAG: hypothetical protein ABW122_14475, partial [Ilumatobacteraceae bacterium]
MSRRAALPVLVALGALGVASCASGEAASPPSAGPTVANVGALPGTMRIGGTTTTTTTSPPRSPVRSSTSTTVPTDADARPVGRLVDGNRVLVIGDSILASTATRYGGDMCDRLVPMGWAVEIDAETGRRIGFGEQVLERRLAADWDAAVIMLGNNYDGDAEAFGEGLEAMLDELAPRPVVLLSVTQFEANRAEVNYVLREQAGQRPNVRVVEWADRTADDDGELLGGDGLHLPNEGRRELALMVSRALGRAPAGSEGDCLPTRFSDD